MKITLDQFQRHIDERIRSISGHNNDPAFVETLRNYTVGLVKHHDGDEANMRRKLKEFLEENTNEFVTWLTEYISQHEMLLQDSGEPARQPTEAVRDRNRDSASDQRLRSVITRTETHKIRSRERNSASPMDDIVETGRNRSRSPGVAARIPVSQRLTHMGNKTMFEGAIRAAAGEVRTVIEIKEEDDDTVEHPVGLKLEGPARGGRKVARFPAMQIRNSLAPAGNGVTNALLAQKTRTESCPANVDNKSVVVMNVNFQSTPEALGMFFHRLCGNVVRVTILKNPHGMSKGYAYMQLKDTQAAQRALQMSGTEFLGRKLRIVPKLTQPPQPSTAAHTQALASLPPWLVQSMMAMVMQQNPAYAQQMQQMRPRWNSTFPPPPGMAGPHSGGLPGRGRSRVWVKSADPDSLMGN